MGIDLSEPGGWTLVVIGAFLLIGYAAHVAGKHTHVPRVTLLLLLGAIAGPSALDLLPDELHRWFPVVAQCALSLVGFILGERFFGKSLRATGRVVVGVAVAETVGAALVVFVGLLAVGTPWVMALVLAGVAPACAPAASVDVINESEAEGPLTDTVLGVVAIDDAFGVILFSLLLVVGQAAAGDALTWTTVLHGAWEVLGAGLLGFIIGVPTAWVTGRASPGELTLLEALGAVLLCGGLASVIGVSYLLACMTLGAVVARRAHHHERPLHAVEGILQPFLVVFFLLAGFEFDLGSFVTLGLVGIVYVLARTAGKIIGGSLGARLVGADPVIRNHVGWCLLPQAGVALGLALIAAERFPDVGPKLLSILVGTTFIFEVVGPWATKIAIRHAGEFPPASR